MTQSDRVKTETYIVLKKLDLLKKLPNDLQELIKNSCKDHRNFIYYDSLPLEYQNLSQDTRNYLTYLYIKYFCKSSNERKQYQVIMAENAKKVEINERKLEEEKRKIYNPRDIFKKTNKSTTKIPENKNTRLLIEYKEPFFAKLKKFILKILHIDN